MSQEGRSMDKSKIKVLYINHFCTGKAVGTTHSQCVFVALVIQHAVRVRHIVICDLTGSTTFFSTLSLKNNDFPQKKKRLLNIKYVF